MNSGRKKLAFTVCVSVGVAWAVWAAPETTERGNGTTGTLKATASREPYIQPGIPPGDRQAGTLLVSEFADFAGSDINAVNLVTGLRNGAQITLNAANGTSGIVVGMKKEVGSAWVAFTVPTGPMGYSNVYLNLAFARQQLAKLGIAEPSPNEIKAALVGGSVTTSKGATVLPGMLTLRSQGQGWWQIAKAQGVKLGPIVRGAEKLEHQLYAAGDRNPDSRAENERPRHEVKADHTGRLAAVGARSHVVSAGDAAGKSGTAAPSIVAAAGAQ